jgi:hypothetical protein
VNHVGVIILMVGLIILMMHGQQNIQFISRNMNSFERFLESYKQTEARRCQIRLLGGCGTTSNAMPCIIAEVPAPVWGLASSR